MSLYHSGITKSIVDLLIVIILFCAELNQVYLSQINMYGLATIDTLCVCYNGYCLRRMADSFCKSLLFDYVVYKYTHSKFGFCKILKKEENVLKKV